MIFETGGIGKTLLARSVKHAVRGTFGDDEAAVESKDALAKSVYLIALVGDVEDGNLPGAVPGTKIIDDRGAEFGVQTLEWLIQQDGARRGSERPCQGYPLRFAAGNLRGLAISETVNPKCFEQILDGVVA